MHYAKIKYCDVANGTGVRVTLFVSGCRNHCKGCFQPETWDFAYGTEFTGETEDELMDMLSKPHIQGLTLLGGEPFEPENQMVLFPFLCSVRNRFPEKDIWAFSGYTLEEITAPGSHPHCEVTDEFLSLIDVLVDGKFEEEKKNISLRFRGSENQRVIDLNKTREAGEVVWKEEMQ